MSNENLSKEQQELINQMKNMHSKNEVLQSIPEDMKKRLDEIMNNGDELRRILNSERAKALYKLISEDKREE